MVLSSHAEPRRRPRRAPPMVNNDATLLDWNSGWAVALCLVLICGVILLWIFLLVRLLTQAAPAPGAAPRGRRAATTTLGRTLSRANLAGEDMFRAVRGVRRRSADRASATINSQGRRVETSTVEGRARPPPWLTRTRLGPRSCTSGRARRHRAPSLHAPAGARPRPVAAGAGAAPAPAAPRSTRKQPHQHRPPPGAGGKA